MFISTLTRVLRLNNRYSHIFDKLDRNGDGKIDIQECLWWYKYGHLEAEEQEWTEQKVEEYAVEITQYAKDSEPGKEELTAEQAKERFEQLEQFAVSDSDHEGMFHLILHLHLHLLCHEIMHRDGGETEEDRQQVACWAASIGSVLNLYVVNIETNKQM